MSDSTDGSQEEFTAEDKASFQAELRKKNNEAKSLRDRLTEAEARLEAFNTAGITDPAAVKAELDRLAAENAEMTTTKDALTLEVARLNVGIDKGLPKAVIARLKGSDETELAEDADSLIPLLSAKSDPFPKADPSQGVQGKTGTPSNADMFAEQLSDF